MPTVRGVLRQIDRLVGALVWLAGVGFCTLLLAFLGSDSGTPQAGRAVALVLAVGGVVGLAPLVRLISSGLRAWRRARAGRRAGPTGVPAAVRSERSSLFRPNRAGLLWMAASVLALYLLFSWGQA